MFVLAYRFRHAAGDGVRHGAYPDESAHASKTPAAGRLVCRWHQTARGGLACSWREIEAHEADRAK